MFTFGFYLIMVSLPFSSFPKVIWVNLDAPKSTLYQGTTVFKKSTQLDPLPTLSRVNYSLGGPQIDQKLYKDKMIYDKMIYMMKMFRVSGLSKHHWSWDGNVLKTRRGWKILSLVKRKTKVICPLYNRFLIFEYFFLMIQALFIISHKNSKPL